MQAAPTKESVISRLTEYSPDTELVYQVLKDEGVVKILRLWTRYE